MISQKTYFKCSVKVETENDKGKVVFRKEEYLVNAVNPTDVETQINKELEGSGEFEIVSIVATKIISVLDK
jgi:Domain of unknown function (DUF4494)